MTSLGQMLVGAALLLAIPQAAAAADLKTIISICTEGRDNYDARVARLKAEGLTPIKGRGKLWVQAQVAHIAMGDLEYSSPDDPADLRGTYNDFAKSARDNDLFRDDIRFQQFTNTARNVELSFSRVDGDWACSIAYGKGATQMPVPLRTKKQWKSSAGTYTQYRINGGRFASGSTLGPVWDRWIKGKRRAAAFLTVSEES